MNRIKYESPKIFSLNDFDWADGGSSCQPGSQVKIDCADGSNPNSDCGTGGTPFSDSCIAGPGPVNPCPIYCEGFV